MIEAAAGLLDNASPEERIRAEAEEETGYRLGEIKKVFEAFMSPGSVTEKLHFFVAEYESSMQVGSGGGIADEGEDIEVLELPIDQALAMIADGRIADAKTIMLLQYAALNIFGRTVGRRVGKGALAPCPPSIECCDRRMVGTLALCPAYDRSKQAPLPSSSPTLPLPCAARPSSASALPPRALPP